MLNFCTKTMNSFQFVLIVGDKNLEKNERYMTVYRELHLCNMHSLDKRNHE